jgi:hypothetical protein
MTTKKPVLYAEPIFGCGFDDLAEFPPFQRFYQPPLLNTLDGITFRHTCDRIAQSSNHFGLACWVISPPSDVQALDGGLRVMLSVASGYDLDIINSWGLNF